MKVVLCSLKVRFARSLQKVFWAAIQILMAWSWSMKSTGTSMPESMILVIVELRLFERKGTSFWRRKALICVAKGKIIFVIEFLYFRENMSDFRGGFYPVNIVSERGNLVCLLCKTYRVSVIF